MSGPKVQSDETRQLWVRHSWLWRANDIYSALVSKLCILQDQIKGPTADFHTWLVVVITVNAKPNKLKFSKGKSALLIPNQNCHKHAWGESGGQSLVNLNVLVPETEPVLLATESDSNRTLCMQQIWLKYKWLDIVIHYLQDNIACHSSLIHS